MKLPLTTIGLFIIVIGLAWRVHRLQESIDAMRHPVLSGGTFRLNPFEPAPNDRVCTVPFFENQWVYDEKTRSSLLCI